MSLPKLKVPIYSTELPSGQNIKFRPYVLGERKLLLMAAEGEDQSEILSSIKTVVSNCIQTPKDFNIEEISNFDLEYISMQIRAKSVSEIIELTVICSDCTTETDIDINIDNDITIKKNKKHKNKIDIGDGIGVILTYPSINISEEIKDLTKIEEELYIIKKSIKEIYDSKSVYNINDYNEKELDEFVNNLSTKQYDKIKEFFITAPEVICSKKWICGNEKCKKEHTLHLRGLNDFFI